MIYTRHVPLIYNNSVLSPPDDVVLWRYLDLAKFVDMLETQTLWFSRADQLEDPLEGGYTDAELEAFRLAPESPGSLYRALKEYEELPRKARMTTYLNCWRRGAHESLAMWDLYRSRSGTLAIKTLVGRLRSVLEISPESLLLAEVEYVDWSHLDDVTDCIHLCTRKEMSYEHEAEVRLLMTASIDQVFDSFGTPPGCRPPFHQSFGVIENALPRGRRLGVRLQDLVTEVVVGPREPAWIADLIQRLMARYELSKPLLRSDRLKARS